MKEVKSKAVQKISVKAYADLIGKSDKTVYKMIKDGLVAAKKGKSGYEVVVDTFIHERSDDINKELGNLRETVKDLAKRIEKLESMSVKKKTVPKKIGVPVKKTLKKSVAKAPLKKKPLKKVVKKSSIKSPKSKTTKK